MNQALLLSPPRFQMCFSQRSPKLNRIPLSPSKKEPAKPVDWAQIEQTLTPAFLGNLNTVNLPFDMHIPSVLGTNWQYQSLNEKDEETQKITVPKVELQADATDHLVKLQKLDIDSSLGTLSSQGQLQLNDDFPVISH